MIRMIRINAKKLFYWKNCDRKSEIAETRTKLLNLFNPSIFSSIFNLIPIGLFLSNIIDFSLEIVSLIHHSCPQSNFKKQPMKKSTFNFNGLGAKKFQKHVGKIKNKLSTFLDFFKTPTSRLSCCKICLQPRS